MPRSRFVDELTENLKLLGTDDEEKICDHLNDKLPIELRDHIEDLEAGSSLDCMCRILYREHIKHNRILAKSTKLSTGERPKGQKKDSVRN